MVKVIHNNAEAVQAPEYAPIRENEQFLLALGITADHIAALPMIVKTGTAFLLLEVRTHEMLAQLRPAADSLQLLSEQYNLAGCCIFCRPTGQEPDALARMVTFSLVPETEPDIQAACALACYLYDIAMIKKNDMVILQVDAPPGAGPVRLVVHLQLYQGKIVALQPGPSGEVQ